MTLAEFLLARIAEDEQTAQTERTLREVDPYFDDPGEATAFERRFDPAWVLAECDAKRRIVELHKLVTEDYAGRWWTDPGSPEKYVTTGCDKCRAAGTDGDEYLNDGPCLTLRLLALPYASHADYQQEWTP